MVPGPKVGLIIGKGGETIKQLQDKSGARMTVIQDGSMNQDQEKPLRISGDPQSVEVFTVCILLIAFLSSQGTDSSKSRLKLIRAKLVLCMLNKSRSSCLECEHGLLLITFHSHPVKLVSVFFEMKKLANPIFSRVYILHWMWEQLSLCSYQCSCLGVFLSCIYGLLVG